MKSHFILLAAIILFLSTLSPFLTYLLPPLASRIVLFSVFLLPTLFIVWSCVHYRKKGLPRWLIPITLVFFISAVSVLTIADNLVRFPMLLEGSEYSETRLLAANYGIDGRLTFSTSHSYFFQTPFLLYAMSIVLGISSIQSSILFMFLDVSMTATVSFYVARTILADPEDPRVTLLAYTLVFALFTCGARVYTAVPYRYLASRFSPLLLFFFVTGYKKRTVAFSVTTVVLTVLITLGDPTACLLLIIPFFMLFSIFTRTWSFLTYAMIPLIYIYSTATVYTRLLLTYSSFAWEGIADFFESILGGELPTRILPWGRSSLPIAEDVFTTSLAYATLIAFSILLLTVVAYTSRTRQTGYRSSHIFAVSLCLLFVLVIALGTYVGASVRSEVSFSDIRTIVLITIPVLCLSLFASKDLLAEIARHRIMLFLIIALLLTASLRNISNVYPKSMFDPINAVEDGRGPSLSIHYVAKFLETFENKVILAFDYKTGSKIVSSDRFTKTMMQSNIPYSNQVVFDIEGLRYGSLYTSPQAYFESFDLISHGNVLYSSGDIVVATYESLHK